MKFSLSTGKTPHSHLGEVTDVVCIFTWQVMLFIKHFFSVLYEIKLILSASANRFNKSFAGITRNNYLERIVYRFSTSRDLLESKV